MKILNVLEFILEVFTDSNSSDESANSTTQLPTDFSGNYTNDTPSMYVNHDE
jgi:hypothetical protein